MQKDKQQLKNIWDVAGAPFSPDEIELEKAYRRVMAHVRPRRWHESPVAVYWQRAAAILLLPLLAGAAYWGANRSQPPAGAPAEAVVLEVSTPPGTFTRMNLPDGSPVWLNAGSRLTYPAVFPVEGERRVKLEGEAYFEVTSNERNPFTVETPNLRVEATGTAFLVEAYPKDSLVAVTLARGNVSVNIDHSLPIALSPNERMEYNRNEAQYSIRPTDTYKWYAWKDGLMVFRDDPLDYVFKRIGQTFNVRIEVKDSAIARHPYRATFEDESLDEILRLLSLTAPIRYTYFNKNRDPNNSHLKQRIEVYRK